MLLEFYTASVGIAGFVGAVSPVGGCFGFSHLPVTPWAIGLLVCSGCSVSRSTGPAASGRGRSSAARARSRVRSGCMTARATLDPAWWILGARMRSTPSSFVLGHDGDGPEPVLDTHHRPRGELIGEMGVAEVGVDPRRRRSRTRCAVAGPDPPGHAHHRDRRCRAGGRRSRVCCSRSSPRPAGRATHGSCRGARYPGTAVHGRPQHASRYKTFSCHRECGQIRSAR